MKILFRQDWKDMKKIILKLTEGYCCSTRGFNWRINSALTSLNYRESISNFRQRCESLRKNECKHRKEIYLSYNPTAQLYNYFCNQCGYSGNMTCSHGGSGQICPTCKPKLAKKVNEI